ncbi:myo-inositol-1(or 4)-monophosphatase [Hamadaea flava]|uniref:Inositol monophosphatase family protein n=1 Tax=Hamadaea flava TaxID=1742688 RepID=A0ABV8LLB9_9ACTN|nr:inositol monophosphatase family protein [Hamadaea flava]MCP2323546.1 myo-inositol-1(or 4)-monophosphatase [Hamadaea flava]
MTPTAGLSELSDILVSAVLTVMAEVRPKLIEAAFSGEHGEGENKRHADNFLSQHDLWMHSRYRALLASQLRSFIYASEEAEPELIGEEAAPDLLILVDPLDTSELAVRGLNGYTHIMAYSRSRARPVAAVVGDIYHHVQLYVATLEPDGQDRAYAITADGTRRRLFAREPKLLSESIVTNYLMRPGERFVPLSRQSALLAALAAAAPDGKQRGRIGVDFGSIGLCHVASGFTDAIIEFAKGFAIWDLAPGHYILSAAGGAVVDLGGVPLSLDYDLSTNERIVEAMKPRQKFVAAGSAQLAEEIVRVLSR